MVGHSRAFLDQNGLSWNRPDNLPAWAYTETAHIRARFSRPDFHGEGATVEPNDGLHFGTK